MKENAFTVPEGFFEEASAKALEGSRRIRFKRRIVTGAIAAALILALVLIPTFNRNDNQIIPEYDVLAELYEYDVFLNNINY